MIGARIAIGIAAAALAAAGAGALRRGGTPESGPPPAAPAVVVFVSAPVTGRDPAPGRAVPGSRIAAAPLDGRGPVRVLSAGFAAASSPRVSFDGKEVLFAGRREEGERDSIWAVRADGSGARRVAGGGSGDCGAPALLPDGRVAFTRDGALFTASPDGTDERRLTQFVGGADLDPAVLADGRVLFARDAGEGTLLLAVHADGTGVHAFHGPGLPPRRIRRPREDGGRAVWAVADGRVVRIDARRPERAAADGAPGLEGTVAAAEPLPGGALLVSVRPGTGRASFGLRVLGPAGAVVADDPGRDEVDPVLLAPSPRPKGHLSVVLPDGDRGRIYCIDARRTARGIESPVPARMRVLEAVPGGERLLGEAPLEADGSFYAEVPADRPLRLEALDEEGRAIRGSGFDFWVRPNEIRACIGCHEDPATAPPNVLPAAVRREPVDMVAR